MKRAAFGLGGRAPLMARPAKGVRASISIEVPKLFELTLA
jgi:hypothetical protein